MNFSIIITTRNRPDYLKNLITSIYNTSKDISNVEIHVNYDEDDDSSHNIVMDFLRQKTYLLPHKRSRSVQMHKDYINWCALNFCTGKYIISVNDDVLFKKQNWDTDSFPKLEEYLKDKPDGVVYARIEDGEKSKIGAAPWTQGLFSCFPLISLKAIKALGWMFDNEFPGWNADIAIHEVYLRLGRIFDLREDIILEHLSTHSGKRPVDEVHRQMNTRCNNGPRWDSFVERDVQILTNYINSIKKE